MARRLALALLGVAPVAYRQDVAGGALTRLADPGTAPVRDVAYTQDGRYLAVAQTASNYAVYRRDDDTHTALTRPVAISTAATGAAWHEDGRRLAFTFGAANRAYAFLRTDDAYAYAGANVGSNPTSSPQQRAIEYSGDLVAIGVASTPMIFVYSVASSGVLTRITTGVPTPHSPVVALAWSPDGSILALGCTIAPRLILYSRSGTTFTRLPDPVQPSTSTPGGMAFSPDGTRFVYSAGDLYYFTHDGAGTLTRSTDPDVQPPGTTLYAVAFDHEGTQVAACSDGAPFVTLYTHTGDALLAQPTLADPPSVDALSIAWTPDDTPSVVEVALPSITLDARGELDASASATRALAVELDAGAALDARVEATRALAITLDGSASLEARAGAHVALRVLLEGRGELLASLTPLARTIALRVLLDARGDLLVRLRAPALPALVATTSDVQVIERLASSVRVVARTGEAQIVNRTGVARL